MFLIIKDKDKYAGICSSAVSSDSLRCFQTGWKGRWPGNWLEGKITWELVGREDDLGTGWKGR